MPNDLRDQTICTRYQNGETLQALADEFRMTKGRAHQIIRKYNLTRKDREHTTRDEFLGVNLSESVKAALREETQRRGVSMSEFTSELLVDMLRCCGYQLEADNIVETFK